MEYLKIFFNKLVLKKKLSLNELKVKLSIKISSIAKDIEERKVKEEDFQELLSMIMGVKDISKREVEDWTHKVTLSLTPESVSSIDEILYDMRWDIVFLSKEDYFSFQDYVSYSIIVCETMISDKIKVALSIAEQVALKKELQVSSLANMNLFGKDNDDLLN